MRTLVRLVFALTIALLPAAAFAQGTIAGTVRDTSGAVLPGVTVEAASPVLIEKVRTAVDRRHRPVPITELRPGTYIRHLHAARLQHRQARGRRAHRRRRHHHQRRTARRRRARDHHGHRRERRSWTCRAPAASRSCYDETLNALPATRGYNALVFLVPSVTGGSNQIDLIPAMRIFYSHGGRGNEGRVSVDGLSVGSALNGGGVSGYIVDTANSQEMQVALSGGLGETETGGAIGQLHPEDRRQHVLGHRLLQHRRQVVAGQQPRRSARELRPARIRPRSTRTGTCSVSLGGPIKRDKLWFFGNYRDIGSHDTILGMYANKNAGDPTKWTYEQDVNVKARNAVATDDLRPSVSRRRSTPRNKVGFYFDYQQQCDGSSMSTRSEGCRRAAATGWPADQTNVAPEAASGAQGTASGAFGYANTLPERHPGHLDVAGHQPAAVRSGRLDATSACGAGWSRRARSST